MKNQNTNHRQSNQKPTQQDSELTTLKRELAFLRIRVGKVEKDAARWQVARQYLEVPTVQSWTGPDWKGQVGAEDESVLVDAAIDSMTPSKKA
jgi:hypothetical protein